MKQILKKILYAFIFLVIGGLTMFFIYSLARTEKCDKALGLINEEIRCSKEYVISKHEYTSVKGKILDYFENEVKEKRLTRYSVYFRDLDNGPLFGINEKDKFIPASLLKLPVMLVYFKLAESDPELLKEKLVFEWVGNDELVQYYKPSRTIVPGQSYTVEELIEYMIIYSDNASYEVLVEYLNQLEIGGEIYWDTLRELGIIEPTSNTDESMSPKSYASIFRSLYNASYLSKYYSNKALDILSRTDFKNGLRYGIPSTVKIANKFGERFGLSDSQKELHDCGVVYFPGNPYLVCIMVEGYKYEDMSKAIGQVSKMLYKEVSERKI